MCARLQTATAVAVALFLGSFSAQGAIIETTFTGTVAVSSDASNILGYGGSSAANGHRVTFTFRFDTAKAPGDFYGGARFPVEADYWGGSTPWISAVVKFDNGFTLGSADFDGTGGLEQQVKIQDNCARCSFDVIGGAAWDYYGNFIQIATERNGRFIDTFAAGSRIFDYTQSLLSNLSIDQLVNWSAATAPGVYYADGQFAYRHVDYLNSANDFEAVVWLADIDSLTSRTIAEPATLALAALGLTALGFTRRRRQ